MTTFRSYAEADWGMATPKLRGPTMPRRLVRRRAVQPSRAGRLPLVEIANVEFHAIGERQTVEYILDELDAGVGGVVVTPNLDYVRRCNRDLQFHAMVSEADLAVADGMPLIWASRLQGTPLPERVAGSNLISSLSSGAARRGKRIFLLGGAPGSAEGAAAVLCERDPTTQIAGIHCPPMGFDKNPKLWDEMVATLIAAKPDIVFVALGAPKQERTICRLQNLLPNSWWVGVGNSFSFLAGQVRRAPKWMQKSGLEWTHRLVQEPGKLWKRYIVAGIPFAATILGFAACKGVPNRLRRLAGRNGSATLAEAPAELIDSPAESAAPSLVEPPTTEPLAELQVRPIAPRPASYPADWILSRLRSVILLGGSVRPSPLSVSTGRSILDLPLDENGSLLNFWLVQSEQVRSQAGLEKLPVRVLVNQASREPVSASDRFFGSFRVEKDLSEYRGTGGVLRDVAANYADDDFVLVANACQILLDPLTTIVQKLADQGGDVNLVCHRDGTPSGVQLLACKTLRQIQATGYQDMKEQALPRIAADFDVRALRWERPSGLPVRTLEDYVLGLRLYHRAKQGLALTSDPLVEDWTPAFSLIETGAKVDASARVYDSVVLDGSTVGPGAVLVRSLVCDSAVVHSDRPVVDQYVTAAPRTVGPMPVAAAW